MTDRRTEPPPRPADFARIALASGNAPPRARARDQQADLTGEELRRRVLNRLTVLDPEPDGLEAALLAVIVELGEPTGPTRGVCTTLLQEWQMARLQPGSWRFLMDQAIRDATRDDSPPSGPPPRHVGPE
jgi:hypothetical protein